MWLAVISAVSLNECLLKAAERIGSQENPSQVRCFKKYASDHVFLNSLRSNVRDVRVVSEHHQERRRQAK